MTTKIQYHPEYDKFIALAIQRTNLPMAPFHGPDWHTIFCAQIQHESNWNPTAVGDGGEARGLMQVHRAACDEMGFSWDAMFDPEQNITCGIEYFAKYHSELVKVMSDSDSEHIEDINIASITMGLFAYNRGPTVTLAGVRYADAVCLLAWAGFDDPATDV